MHYYKRDFKALRLILPVGVLGIESNLSIFVRNFFAESSNHSATFLMFISPLIVEKNNDFVAIDARINDNNSGIKIYYL